jgi:phospholipid transport system substrate-binding protein
MKILSTISTLFLAAAMNLAWAQEAGPEMLIQRITDEVMAAIQADQELAAGDKDKALKLAEQKVLPHVDFEEATRLAVSRAWSRASPEQQKTLITEFRAMLLRTYTNAIGTYAGTQARLLPTRGKPEGEARGSEATVRYQFVRSGGRPILVAYELRKTGAGWKIYDISIEGISLVLTYRTEFDGILKQEGVDGLIKKLAQKNTPAKLAL